jgi:hypothetical protein
MRNVIFINRRNATAFAICVLIAGVAHAIVGSRVEQGYGGGLNYLINAQKHIANLRLQIDQAKAEDIVALAPEAIKIFRERYPSEVKLAITGIEETLKGVDLNISSLSSEQSGELVSTLNLLIDPKEIASYIETGKLSDKIFAQGIFNSLEAVYIISEEFIDILDKGDYSIVQEKKAELILTMARLDIVVSYFVILVERTKV